MFHSEERIPYQTLKFWALDAYFDFCRDSGVVRGWSHEMILGRVDYEYEGGFERPVENLMWQVIMLILSGGWLPDWGDKTRSIIVETISIHGLNALLHDVPNDEIDIFIHDLTILGLVEN